MVDYERSAAWEKQLFAMCGYGDGRCVEGFMVEVESLSSSDVFDEEVSGWVLVAAARAVEME